MIAIVAGCKGSAPRAPGAMPMTRLDSAPREFAGGVAGEESSARVWAKLSLDEGTFAWVSPHGDSLVALARIPDPSRIGVALCASSAVYRVAFARDQTGDMGLASPQIGANFANTPGQMFGILGKAPGGGTCFLSADSALIGGLVSLGPRAMPTCPPDWVRSLSTAKRQEVAKCWPVATGPGGVQILAAQFVPQRDSVLASFVLMDRTTLLFEDFPAAYRGPGESTWRVDDEGIFYPESFNVLWLSRVRGTWVMALTWAGAEGEDADLLAADSAHAFRTVTSSYRYWGNR
jgi:hypothetical protein